jgi:hypothetical protein
MPDLGSPPSIIVRQVFVEALGVKIIPTQPACIVGEHFQIETQLTAGLYDTAFAPTTYVYPDKVVGAVIQTPATDVQVFLETVEDEFDITLDPALVRTADDFTLSAGVAPEKEVKPTAQISTVAGTQLIDPSALFITDGIRAGDIVQFDTVGPLEFVDSVLSAQAGDYTVLNVLDQTTIQVTPALILENKVEYRIERRGTAAGTVKVSYKAKRFDLVNQLVLVQGVEDGELQLGRLDTPDNPIGFAFSIAAVNTDLAVAVTAVSDDVPLEHQRASEFIEGRAECYGIVPLSQNPQVFQVWQQHVNQQSDPEIGFERVVLINPVIEDFFEFRASRTAIAPVSGPPDSTFVDAGADFTAIPVGSVLHITAVTAPPLIIDGVARTLPFQVQIASFNSATSLEILGVFTTAPGDVTYSVRTLNFTNFQKAANMRDIARSFADRRVWMIFPDQVKTFAGADEVTVPGYFAAAAYAGLRGEVTPSSPLSNVPLAGLTGVIGSTETFSPAQLKTIQSGGVCILFQKVDGAPILVRRQLTTDTSSDLKVEQTATFVPDFAAKFLREGLDALKGRNLITLEFIENQLRPGLNGLLQDMIEERIIGRRTRILSLQKSETNRTTVEARVDFEVLDPFNFFDITLLIQ